MGLAQADSHQAPISGKARDIGSRSPRSLALRALFCLLTAIFLVIYYCCGSPLLRTCPLPRFWLAGPPDSSPVGFGVLPPDVNSTTCPQWSALHPAKHKRLGENLDAVYNSEDFKQIAIQALVNAIRVP